MSLVRGASCMGNREIVDAFTEQRAKRAGGPRFDDDSRPSDEEIREFLNDVHNGKVVVSRTGSMLHVPGPKGYAICNKIERDNQTEKREEYYPGAEFCTECVARSFPEQCNHDVTGPIRGRNNENRTQDEPNR